MSTYANKLERIQQRFVALCFNRFFPQIHYCYFLDLEELKMYTLHMKRHRLDALCLIQVYLGSKLYTSVLEIVGLRVSARYIRDFSLFSICCFARCVSAANVCRDVDVFGANNVLLNHIIL
jgi:hypothetical protein